MMYEEFTKLITTTAPTPEEYNVIERVYTYHPAFDVESPKTKIALLYNLMGFGIFKEMLAVTEQAERIHEEIQALTADLNDEKRKLEELRETYKSL